MGYEYVRVRVRVFVECYDGLVFRKMRGYLVFRTVKKVTVRTDY